MDNILDMLFRGYLSPIDELSHTRKAYKEQYDSYSKHYKSLMDRLRQMDDSLTYALEGVEAERSTLEYMQHSEAFQLGFCFGVTMLLEVSRRMAELA